MNNQIFKRTCLSAIFIALLILPSVTNVYAQSSETYFSNGVNIKLEKQDCLLRTEIKDNGKVVSVQKENPDEVVRLIVTFKEQPLTFYQQKKTSLQKTLSISSVYAALQTGHASFRTAMNSLQQRLSARLNSNYSYTITRDYYRSLNGVALECKRSMMGNIRSLSMVKNVSIDEEVKADVNLKQSLHQIRADIVQDSLRYTGKGILIGDVDTGIDYNNPALGGGFGPGFRVIGGYDFANNDSDPMDDHGHGTHVAGIIGAKGGDTLRGVAPGVRFLAVKVLKADGTGYTSDVIAGIEYCLDPDGNPATNDGVDIINMSLGGAAYPDSPVDIAVDNATKAGVLSVVAAGNYYHYTWGTIGSPGTSETALTVGACDSVNNIAKFSSAGPDPIHSAIKPEVVAPGVKILSTILNNKMESWSGTSMATPHVTGMAALLKQQHPSWTPAEIKAAIVNTAHSVNESESIFVQGKGCVNALDAAKARLLVEPGTINFGAVDLAVNVWTDTVKIKVKNLHSKTQSTQVHIADGVPTGASIAFDKTSFSLAPGEETTIMVVLTVPSSVPVISTDPFSYTGKIEVLSDSESVVVPFSFLKSTTLVVNLDMQPLDLFIFNRKSGKSIHPTVSESLTYKFPVTKADSLEILILFVQKDTLGIWNAYFISHKINNLSELTYVNISVKEATINMINDEIYDSYNNRITIDTTSYFNSSFDLTIKGTESNGQYGFSFSSFVGEKFKLFSSQLDSGYYVQNEMIIPKDPDFFYLGKAVFGLKNRQDIVLASGKDNLYSYNISNLYDDPYLSNTPQKYGKGIGFEIYKLRSGFPHTSSNIRYPIVNKKLNIHFSNQISKMKTSDMYYDYFINIFSINPTPKDTDTPKLASPNFIINEKGEIVFEKMLAIVGSLGIIGYSTPYIYVVLKPGDTISLEQYALMSYPGYKASLANGSISINDTDNKYSNDDYTSDGIRRPNGVYEWISPSYLTNLSEPRFTSIAYANNQTQINTKSSLRRNNQKCFYKYDNLTNTTLRILSYGKPYTLLGQTGQSTIDCEYQIPDNSISAANFPSFDLLQVSVDEKSVDVVSPGQNGKIRLILLDPDSCVTSAKISIVLASGDEIDLPVSFIGGHEYNASIPAYIPKGFIDLAARVKDAKGNKCELIASPGFYNGSATDNIKLDARIRMTTYALNNVKTVKFAAGDTLNYTLSYANYGSVTARNVHVNFPTTPYFKSLGSQSFTVDSIGTKDTITIPLKLIFLGKQLTTGEEKTYYTPSVSWSSGGTAYLRNNKILVEIQNTLTGVAQTDGTLPDKFELYQNYPNPFNPTTTIKYDLPKESRVKIEIYDIMGRKAATLLDETKTAGRYQAVWNANRFASGVYFYRFQASDYICIKKLLLLK